MKLRFLLAAAALFVPVAAHAQLTTCIFPNNSCAGLPVSGAITGQEWVPFDQASGPNFVTSRQQISVILDAIQPPAVSQKGGVFSSAAVTNQFVTGVDTNGNLTRTQPSFSNLSGSLTSTQIGAALSTLGTAAAGDIIYYNGTAWVYLVKPASSGLALTESTAGVPSWASVGGTGTVTNVAMTVPSGLSVSGTPITSTGTFAVSWSGQIPASSIPAFTGDVTTTAGSTATTIASGAVTAAKMASGAAVSNIGYTPMRGSNNLSEITSASSARTNLGLGSSATVNTGTSGGTVPLLNGNNTWSGTTTWQGKLQVPVRVVTGSGTVIVSNTTDYLVAINKVTGAATTVDLPSSPATGDVYVIKDDKGDAATNNITVTPASGNIDGASTFVMNVNHQSAAFTYDGTQWEVN